MEISDADLILEIIKIIGVPEKEFLENINFKNYKKFIFPKMSKKSMRKVEIH